MGFPSDEENSQQDEEQATQRVDIYRLVQQQDAIHHCHTGQQIGDDHRPSWPHVIDQPVKADVCESGAAQSQSEDRDDDSC